MGFQSTVINMAYAVGPAAGGWLCDLYGARSSFVIVGSAALLTSAGFSLLPETKGQSAVAATGAAAMSDEAGKQEQQKQEQQQPTVWEVYEPLLRSPDQQGLLAMNFAVFSSYSAMMAVFPLQMIEVLPSASAGEIGSLFALSALVGFVGAPLGGFLADKIGRKNTVVPSACLISAGALLTASLGTGSAFDIGSYMLSASATTAAAVAADGAAGATTSGGLSTLSFYTVLPPVLLWGMGNSMTNPGLSAFAADIADDEATRGQALALSRMAGDAAFLLAPAGLGFLAQLTDCATALNATAAIVLGANLTFALRATERQRGGQQE